MHTCYQQGIVQTAEIKKKEEARMFPPFQFLITHSAPEYDPLPFQIPAKALWWYL